MPYKDKTACVYDHGLFCELASVLARDFGKVLYYTPWESGYPKSNAQLMGRGLDGVTRVQSIWPFIDEIDIFVFPDVYEGALQVHLASIGKRVWGARMAEEIELDRLASKAHLKDLGVDIGPYQEVVGLDALREYLRAHKDQFVKVSSTRGDMETFKAKEYDLIEPRLDDLEHTLGAKKKIMHFIVEQELSPAVEVGYDGFTVDGKFPDSSIWGVEIKDKAYLGRHSTNAELPAEVVDVNDKLAATFGAYQYRGFWSSELRITPDKKAYMIDPCTRAGSPPNELLLTQCTNLADIIWEGAEGTVVQPTYASLWGAELFLTSSWADKNWQAVEFPPSIRDNVKLRQATVIEGKYYVVPQWTDVSAIGAVVALGDTRDAAIKECKRLAEQVQGHYIDIDLDALDAANEEFDQLKQYGLDFAL